MNIWSRVVQKLHEATEACNNEHGIHHWDEAVALYTGSIANFPGDEGYLLFFLAQTECSYFGTCSEGQMAQTNERIFAAFLLGKRFLKNKQCQNLTETSREIESVMTVPLVQSVLRRAYDFDKHDNQLDRTQGEAAAFAASLLPRVHSCQEASAFTMWSHLTPGNAPQAGFDDLKSNLEQVYDCLGISCSDVGGLLHLDPSSGQMYSVGAEPCGVVSYVPESPNDASRSPNPQSDHQGRPLKIGLFVAVGILLAILVALGMRRCSSKPTKTLEMELSTNRTQIEDDRVAVENGEVA